MKPKHYLLVLFVLMIQATAVLAQPVITTQPQNQTNLAGTTAMFTVGATGTMPLSYQWRSHSGPNSFTNIPWGTETTLMLTNVQPTSRRFAVVVSDAGGLSVTSSPLVSLTVVGPPTVQPTNATASLFADVKFTGTVSAAGPVSYQWLFNGEPIVGAVTNSLSVTNIQKTNAGDYALVATYAFGATTSSVARLTITPFNSMYEFGFSWTDTHNCGWSPPQYYSRHACNGPMWPEFLSTNLGLAYVEANNYAFCGATASDVLNQVINYPAPAKPMLSLYFLWAGDSDFLRAYPPDGGGFGYLPVTNELAWTQLIQTIISSNSNAVNRLYLKGARAIVIQTLDDFSKEPDALRAFGTNSAALAKLSEYITRCNAGIIGTMNTFGLTKPDLRILTLDILPKFNDVLSNPVQYGFTKTDIDALADTSLTDKSFTGPGADYAFWDGGHVTSKFNELFASWHLELLTNSILETLQLTAIGGTPNIQMNHLLIGRDYTLQRSTDLSSWNDVESFTATAGTNRWSLPEDSHSGSFFRLKWSHAASILEN